jgi:hypothetical protein
MHLDRRYSQQHFDDADAESPFKKLDFNNDFARDMGVIDVMVMMFLSLWDTFSRILRRLNR